ncbi:transmembrane protein, putative [Medicago truncatula]|uniref:Transmembrane protein, putative n=1 Tax=Medicago truncatula TaxID=3880 RepID=G7L2Q6_MEDTR|nr:transmembrane protein, putative [Medicago truncatula]
MEDVRDSLMVVATALASLTFQNCAHDHDQICKAGTLVLAFGDSNQKLIYELFILSCTIFNIFLCFSDNNCVTSMWISTS